MSIVVSFNAETRTKGFTFVQLTQVTDTSSSQARKGQDIQGIPWERLNITREKYRFTRLEQYKNYENIPLSGEAVDKVLLFVFKKKKNNIDMGIIFVGLVRVLGYSDDCTCCFRSANLWRKVATTMNSFIIPDWLSLPFFIFRFVSFATAIICLLCFNELLCVWFPC